MKKKSILLKIHPPVRGSQIIALCDSELLGKKFETASLVLDLEKYRRFYDGDECGEDTVIAALDGCVNVNAVGERSVSIACKALKVEKSAAKKIGGVPHLQIYRI